MALTDEQLKALIAAELGKTGDSAFASHLDLVWELYEAHGTSNPRLRYLLAKRDAILYAIGGVATLFDYKEGDVSKSKGQLVRNLHLLLEPVNAELAALGASAQVVVGQMTRTAPIQADDPRETQYPDPNARRLKGDPLEPGWPWPVR